MKITKLTIMTAVALCASAVTCNAWLKVGNVFCDANTNGIIDIGDTPVQSVLVVVTNTSGTFSNANWTTAEGLFIVELPDLADSYVDYVHPLTVPFGTTAILPVFNTFSVTSNAMVFTNSFLLENPACASVQPPPPPNTNSAGCWLTGGGTIKSGKGKPVFSFGGVVNPGCSPTAAGGGNWNVIAHQAKLHFKGLIIEVVDCGNVPGVRPGSKSPKTPFNFIEFQGTGVLSGIGGNKVDYGAVSFFAHAEDLGEPGHRTDRLYLRVYDGTGNTLLLISGETANPLDVSPVAISTGNLQIHRCK